MNTIGCMITSNPNIGCLENEFGRCLKGNVFVMNKDGYIDKIKEFSDDYTDYLLILMDKYNKSSLREITYEEIKEYYEEINE